MDKKVLFVVYQAPVGAIWVNETFRSAFGMYADDVEPTVLLMDAAVIALSSNTCPESLGLLPVSTVQRYVRRYETEVLAVAEDVEQYQVTEIADAFGVKMVPEASLCEMFHSYDNVIFM